MSDARFPRIFGKYVLLRSLARGGMGELYLAATGDLGGAEKLCVVKKVPEADGLSPRDPSKVRRLLDEARVMVRLNQSNLVQVFDSGLVDGELYLAMELVAGRDLRAAWNRCADLGARIPVDMALYVVREVARGLAFAHSYGGLHLVHRDIAPPNILCSWQGEVKITDFGLAASRLKSEKTGPGVVFGRIGYLAPEQARGEAADHRADIYSLGVILWELLTGRPLIEPTLDPAEALRRIATVQAEPPSRHARDLPPTLDQVVLKALSPRREARYSIADEMRQAVGRELLRIAPDVDQGCVVGFLQMLYGDEIEAEARENERLLREELPRARRERGQASGLPGTLVPPTPAGGLTGLRAEIAARFSEGPAARPREGGPPPDVSARLMQIIDGRYRIERLLGEGGMGAVYEAEHIAIRKKVALKVLHRQFSQQADLVARFRREAQAASRVGHPNIIDVTDFGYTADGSAYLVMEHLEGMDLGQVLAGRGRLGMGRALRIAVQLVQALAAAHAAGVIHRDLKPENIFLIHPEEAEATAPWHMGTPSRDMVKVLDFGIAMRLEPSAPIRLTDPGLTVGTPAYMSPEQATGAKVDGRADIYAVGTILYEMLSGRVPFDDSAPLGELLLRKTREEAPPLELLEPATPPPLARLVARCIERDPARRPQSMGELLQGLLALQAALAPVEGRPARTPPEPLPRPGAASAALPAAPPRPPAAAPSSAALPPVGPLDATPLMPLPPVGSGPGGGAPGERGGFADTLAAAAVAEGGPGPQSVWIGAERSDHPEASEPTVPFSTAEHGALLPRPAAPSRASSGPAAAVARGRSASSAQPAAPAAPLALRDSGATPPAPLPRDSGGVAALAAPPPARGGLRLVGGGVAALVLVLAGFGAARYWPAPAPPPRPAPEVPAPVRAPAPPKPAPEPAPGQAARRGPGPEVALLEWARRCAEGGRLVAPPGDNLLELLGRVEAVAPGNAEARRLREGAAAALGGQAREQLRRKDADGALRSYRALAALRAEAPFPRSELAQLLGQQARAAARKNRPRAIESALGAVEVDPESVGARLLLGELYLQAGQRDRAAGEFRRALGMHPDAAGERAARQGLAKAGGGRRRRR